MQSTPASATQAASTQVHELPFWKWVLLLPVVFMFAIWSRTLRIDATSRAAVAEVRKLPGSMLFLMWHNRLFALPRFMRLYQGRSGRPFHAIVSASRDGALLAAFFKLLGFRPLRGSSSRRGAQAALSAVQAVRKGGDLGITVDGPRGPVYRAKPGAAMVAMRAGVPITVAVPVYEKAWRASSWDRFFFPKPFSRIHLRMRTFKDIQELAGDADPNDREQITRIIEQHLLELTRGTDPVLRV